MARTKKTDIEESKNIKKKDILESSVSEPSESKKDESLDAKIEAENEEIELKEEENEEKTEKKKEKSEESIAEKKAKLAELIKKKAKELESGVVEVEEVSLKKKVKPEEEEKETLVPMEDYLKSSIHLGVRVITPDMRKYVYRRRADGVAVFNTALLDDMIREGAEFLAKFAPEDVIIVCKKEAGWKAVKKFSETTGIKAFTKKYPAGILTNTNLDNFMETELVFICDPWLDKNALEDANRIKLPVLSICDTNNFTRKITKVIPGNNKNAKSLGMIFYLLTKLYVEKRKLNVQVPKIEDFVDDWDILQAPK